MYLEHKIFILFFNSLKTFYYNNQRSLIIHLKCLNTYIRTYAKI